VKKEGVSPGYGQNFFISLRPSSREQGRPPDPFPGLIARGRTEGL
jgi:hypothetical protein